MSKIYHSVISVVDKFVPKKLEPLWQHPAGPKTIFFWAPTLKWGLVLAAIGDLQKPPEKLSLNQILSLTCTGIVWSRYSLVIIPKNWNLFSVNAFVASTGIYQLFRIWSYQNAQNMNK